MAFLKEAGTEEELWQKNDSTGINTFQTWGGIFVGFTKSETGDLMPRFIKIPLYF